VRDRQAPSSEAEKIRFTSNILPKWARRSISLDALLPVLYLKGISTGDFQEALSAILGPDAPNLSPSVVSRLTAGWQAQYDAWTRRDLCARHHVYIWADGIYLQARVEENAECMLVIIGATPEGKKELIGFQVGLRESAQSWHELLTDIKGRGLSTAPEIAVGPSHACCACIAGQRMGPWDFEMPWTRRFQAQSTSGVGFIRSKTC
jgi:putative transposase